MNLIKIIFVTALIIYESTSFSQIKKTTDVVTISELQSKVEVKVGQTLKYIASEHGSVGIQSECYSTDETIIKLVEKTSEYKDKEKAEMDGGDASHETSIFEALKVGVTRIIINDYYRGELKNTSTIIVTVIDNNKLPVVISPLRSNMKVKIREKLTYSGTQHASIGHTVSCFSEDENIIKLINSSVKYDKDQETAGKGGDSATKTFTFEALKKGTTTVVIKELFRGKVQKEYTVNITVIGK